MRKPYLSKICVAFLGALLFIGFTPIDTHAQTRHLGAAASPTSHMCPQAIDNACSTSPGGTFIDLTLFTTMRQSGQGQYKSASNVASDHPVQINVCGLDFACGPVTPDGDKSDILTARIPGCSYNPSTWYLTCAPGCPDPANPKTLTISGYIWHDVKLTTKAGACTKYVITDNTYIVGAHGCSQAGGIITIAGNPWTYIGSNKFEFDPSCDKAANMFGAPSAATINGTGFITQSHFVGTLVIGNAVWPGKITLGTGTTGRMYRSQFVDYPGKTHDHAHEVQLLWFTGAGGGWIGTGHTEGLVYVVDSTDPSSPNATPAPGQWITCSMCHRNGEPILRSQGGGWLLQGGAPTIPANTPAVSGIMSCSGSDCDNGTWQVSLGGRTGPIAMTTGPQLGGPYPIAIGQAGQHCYTGGDGVTSMYNVFIDFSYMMNARDDCSIYSQANLLIKRDTYPEHSNSILEQDDTGNGPNNIAHFSQIGDVVFDDQWSGVGTITATFSLFATYAGNKPPPTGWQTNYVQGNFTNNIGVINLSVNNGGDFITPTKPGGMVLRTLNQVAGKTAAGTGYLSDNGDGTGTLHVTSVTSGTISVGLFPTCTVSYLKGCNAYNGPLEIIQQLVTAAGDISTWKTNLYQNVSPTNLSFWSYPGKIATLTIKGNAIDDIGAAAGVALDHNVQVPTLIQSENWNLRTGAAINVQ